MVFENQTKGISMSKRKNENTASYGKPLSPGHVILTIFKRAVFLGAALMLFLIAGFLVLFGMMVGYYAVIDSQPGGLVGAFIAIGIGLALTVVALRKVGKGLLG